MKLNAAIDRFLHHVRVERGLAANTCKAYRRDLEMLRDHVVAAFDATPTLDSVETIWLKDYLSHLRDDRDYRPRSLSRTMSTLRVFFEYSTRHFGLERNPAANLHNPKLPKNLPVFLVDDEIERMLRPPVDGEPLAMRDFCIVVVFLFSGLRLSELVSLDLPRLDLESQTLLVSGKGSKERLVPLHSGCVQPLRKYLRNSRAALATPRCEAVFLDRNGERVTARAVSYAIEKAVKRAGLSHRITPHKLRHTFATQLLHRGASLIEIKELLGHSHIVTTSIYTHTNVQRLRTAVQKLDS